MFRSTHQIANDISLSSIFRLCDCLSLCIVYIGRVAHAIDFILFVFSRKKKFQHLLTLIELVEKLMKRFFFLFSSRSFKEILPISLSTRARAYNLHSHFCYLKNIHIKCAQRIKSIKKFVASESNARFHLAEILNWPKKNEMKTNHQQLITKISDE